MNKVFICKCCEYKTNKKFNYSRHLLSSKHLLNINYLLHCPHTVCTMPNCYFKSVLSLVTCNLFVRKY